VLDVALMLPKMLPDILVTATDMMDRSLLPAFTVFDSGGFLIALEGRFDEADSYLHKLIRIYRKVAAPNDLLLQLDLPILPTMDPKVRLELQKKNVRYFKVMSKIFGSRLVPVLHGWSRTEWDIQLEAVYRSRIIAVGSFFGFVAPSIKKVKSIRLDPKVVATRLVDVTRYLLRHTNARLMLLGAGSPKALYIAAALGYEIADSSTWRVAAFFGEVYNPITLDRVKVYETKDFAVFREAYREIEASYGAPWDFDTWLQLAMERSRIGYIARAWFNAMVGKLVQHRLESMSEDKLIREMMRLYEKSTRWKTIAKIVARYAHYQGFKKAVSRSDRVVQCLSST